MRDLDALELFVHVATLGSLTKAAVKLDLAQSVASRRIAALEANFGGRVFYRTGRGVTLTELGARMLPRVRALLSELDDMTSEAREAATGKPTGTVIVGVLRSVSRPLVSRLYRQVCDQLPGVRLQIVEGSGGRLDEAIANGTADVAVLSRYGDEPPVGEELLARSEMSLIGSSQDPVTVKTQVPFTALDGLPLLLPSAPSAWRGELEKLARRHGIRLNEAMTVDSMPVLIDVVAGGGCYGILPTYALKQDVTEGRISAARIVKPALMRMVTMAITSQRPATLAMLEVARLVRDLVPSIVR